MKPEKSRPAASEASKAVMPDLTDKHLLVNTLELKIPENRFSRQGKLNAKGVPAKLQSEYSSIKSMLEEWVSFNHKYVGQVQPTELNLLDLSIRIACAHDSLVNLMHAHKPKDDPNPVQQFANKQKPMINDPEKQSTAEILKSIKKHHGTEHRLCNELQNVLHQHPYLRDASFQVKEEVIKTLQALYNDKLRIKLEKVAGITDKVLRSAPHNMSNDEISTHLSLQPPLKDLKKMFSITSKTFTQAGFYTAVGNCDQFQPNSNFAKDEIVLWKDEKSGKRRSSFGQPTESKKIKMEDDVSSLSTQKVRKSNPSATAFPESLQQSDIKVEPHDLDQLSNEISAATASEQERQVQIKSEPDVEEYPLAQPQAKSRTKSALSEDSHAAGDATMDLVAKWSLYLKSSNYLDAFKAENPSTRLRGLVGIHDGVASDRVPSEAEESFWDLFNTWVEWHNANVDIRDIFWLKRAEYGSCQMRKQQPYQRFIVKRNLNVDSSGTAARTKQQHNAQQILSTEKATGSAVSQSMPIKDDPGLLSVTSNQEFAQKQSDDVDDVRDDDLEVHEAVTAVTSPIRGIERDSIDSRHQASLRQSTQSTPQATGGHEDQTSIEKDLSQTTFRQLTPSTSQPMGNHTDYTSIEKEVSQATFRQSSLPPPHVPGKREDQRSIENDLDQATFRQLTPSKPQATGNREEYTSNETSLNEAPFRQLPLPSPHRPGFHKHYTGIDKDLSQAALRQSPLSSKHAQAKQEDLTNIEGNLNQVAFRQIAQPAADIDQVDGNRSFELTTDISPTMSSRAHDQAEVVNGNNSQGMVSGHGTSAVSGSTNTELNVYDDEGYGEE